MRSTFREYLAVAYGMPALLHSGGQQLSLPRKGHDPQMLVDVDE